jgi:hypothetical protein
LRPAPNLRRAPKASKALRARRVLRASKARPGRKPLRASKAHRGRKALKANRVRLGRKPLTASKVRLGRKALKANRGFRGRRDRKVRRETKALRGHRGSKVSASKVRPARKAPREKQALQDRRLSVKKDRPDHKVRREKQALQGYKDHKVRKAKWGSKVLQVQPVKLAQQAAQQACMWSGRIAVRTTPAHLPAARVRRLLPSPVRAERYPSQRTGTHKLPRAATARDRPWPFVCRPRNRQGLEDAVPGCLGRAPHSLDFRFLLLGRRGRGVRGFYIFRLLHCPP